jgi:hypothetical protein
MMSAFDAIDHLGRRSPGRVALPVRVRLTKGAPALDQIAYPHLEMRVVRDSQGQADRERNKNARDLRVSVRLAGVAGHV